MPKYLTAKEEAELVGRAKAGDNDAMARVIAGIEPLLWRAALKIASKHRHAEPEDLVQAARLKILQAFRTYDPAVSRLSTYMLPAAEQTMRRAAYANGVIPPAAVEQRNRKPSTQALLIRHTGPLDSLDVRDFGFAKTRAELLTSHREAGPGDFRRTSLIRQAVRRCVAKLPPRYRKMVELKLLEGWTLEEVGDQFGCTRENIRQQLKSALRFLRPILLADPDLREHIAEIAEHFGAAA